MWAVCNSLIRCRPAFLYRLFVLCIQKDYDVAVKKREKAIHLLENEDDTMNTMNQKRYKSRKESTGSREYYRCCYEYR